MKIILPNAGRGSRPRPNSLKAPKPSINKHNFESCEIFGLFSIKIK
ncbi:MAG: hypothetical protein P8L83_04555 [Flavobacteriaceae bacterium]|nr:hypothetical protein [Flavobacteriaceae bacterium]